MDGPGCLLRARVSLLLCLGVNIDISVCIIFLLMNSSVRSFVLIPPISLVPPFFPSPLQAHLLFFTCRQVDVAVSFPTLLYPFYVRTFYLRVFLKGLDVSPSKSLDWHTHILWRLSRTQPMSTFSSRPFVSIRSHLISGWGITFRRSLTTVE